MTHFSTMRLSCIALSIQLALLLLCSGCSHLQFPFSMNMESSSAALARELVLSLPRQYLPLSTLVAAPVEATTLAPGKFGLAMQELLISSLASHGATITEVQLRKIPTITKDEGLLYLSRDAGKIQEKYKASLVVVSSYIVRTNDVVIASRIIMLQDYSIVASATTTLYRSDGVSKLLETPRSVRLYER